MIISTGSRFSPGFALADRAVLEALGKLPLRATEIYGENLDLLLFPSDRFAKIFGDFLKEKYAAQRPDLVILLYIGNLGTAGRLLVQLFPGTPLIVAGYTEEEVSPDQFGSLVSGIAQRVDPRATLELILRLQPETRRIVVIGGTAEIDRNVMDRVKDAATSFAGRVNFEFWDNRSMAELRPAVSALPPRTAILFSRMFRDGAGQAVISNQAGQLIAQWAKAPVYVMTNTTLGTGAVGGSVGSVEALGKRAGELARLILTGTAPASLPFEIRTDTVPVFDWRALQRWGISENRLPPGSVVRFRELTLWAQYRWYVIGTVAIVALQALLIVGLLLHRVRRRQAEADLREIQEFMDISTRAGELGLWVRDMERGDLWANQRLRSLFGFGQNDALRFDDFLARIHADDRSRVDSMFQHAQKDGLFEADFRVVSNGTERWIAAKGQSADNGPGRARRRMGALTDITARKEAESAEQRHRDELAHVSRVSMMGQLASALAHELNQPLGAILRNAEAAELFLQASPPDLQEVCAILADIRKDDQRAGAVIDRMRGLLKRRELQWSKLDLNVLVEEVAGLLRIDAETRRVRLTLELALSAPSVRGDRVLVQQVLLNLILNAMDAVSECEAGKRFVAVRVHPGDAWAEVAVSDTGYSIPEENFKRLFEPFFTTKPNGLGLGLAISRTIIEAHGGHLWAKNNPEAGAAFCFTVPVAGSGEEGSTNVLET